MDRAVIERTSAGRTSPRVRLHSLRSTRRTLVRVRGQVQDSGNPIVGALVGASTEALRILGVGRRGQRGGGPPSPPPPATSMEEFLARLEDDYARMYFITGQLDEGLYDERCSFADPTISFEGLALYQSNLELLIPFLVAPKITLKGIQVVSKDAVCASWILATTLKLPWKPEIYVRGTTTYGLGKGFRVIDHVERWDISPWEAVLMVLGLHKNKPGRGDQP